MDAIAFVHEQITGKKEFPKFKAGDNVTVNYKIIEGNKERIQSFKGDVLKRQFVAHHIQGVAHDLGHALAGRLGVPVKVVEFARVADIVDALQRQP